jgi:hypothetical protein
MMPFRLLNLYSAKWYDYKQVIICKGVVAARLRLLFQHWHEKTEENHTRTVSIDGIWIEI